MVWNQSAGLSHGPSDTIIRTKTKDLSRTIEIHYSSELVRDRPDHIFYAELAVFWVGMASNKSSRNEFEAGPWKIAITRSHILKSKCERGKADGCQKDSMDICDVCKSVAPPSMENSIVLFLMMGDHGGFETAKWGEGGGLMHFEVVKHKFDGR